jgi:hypothetical protein
VAEGVTFEDEDSKYVTVTHGVPYYSKRHRKGGGCFVTHVPTIPAVQTYSNETTKPIEFADTRAFDGTLYYRKEIQAGNTSMPASLSMVPNEAYDPRISLTAFHAEVWRSRKFGALKTFYYERAKNHVDKWNYKLDVNRRYVKANIEWPSENDRWQSPLVENWAMMTGRAKDSAWRRQKKQGT